MYELQLLINMFLTLSAYLIRYKYLFIPSILIVAQYLFFVDHLNVEAFEDLMNYSYWYESVGSSSFFDMLEFHHDKVLTIFMYIVSLSGASFNAFLLIYSVVLICLYCLSAMRILGCSKVIVFIGLLVLSRLQIDFSLNTMRSELFSAMGVFLLLINYRPYKIKYSTKLITAIIIVLMYFTHRDGFYLFSLLLLVYFISNKLNMNIKYIFYTSLIVFVSLFVFSFEEGFSLGIVERVNGILVKLNHHARMNEAVTYIKGPLFVIILLFIVIPNVILLKYNKLNTLLIRITLFNSIALLFLHLVPLAFRIEMIVVPILLLFLVAPEYICKKQVRLYVVFLYLINSVVFYNNLVSGEWV